MFKNFLFMGIFLAAVMAAPLTSCAAHKPVFTWQIRGDVNYQQWIYDGNTPIALFDMSTLDEPMQALMFFSAVPRPILLKYLKFTPDGAPLVQAVQLFWKSGKMITDVLDGLTVQGSGTDRLTVAFTTKDPLDTARATRTLTLTYDNTLESYVYDFKDNVVINDPKAFASGKGATFEFCDPWLSNCPSPSQKFMGMWKGRYSKFAFESPDGSIVAIPHNHFSSSLKGGNLKKDGIFAAVYEPDGNPAIQFLDETASKSHISICPWGYDIHLSYSAAPGEIEKPINTHFRFFKCPDDKARAMEKKAVTPSIKPTEFGGQKEMPMYERISSFDKAVAIEKPHTGELDPWFWVPQDEKGAVWDRSSGRSDKSSLKIEKDTPGVATWYSMCEGQGYYTEPWNACKGYEISCWVKTKDVEGAGASIAARYHVPNITPKWDLSRSEQVSGTKDWTKLTLRLGPPQKDTSIMSIHLQQSGKGTTWFDDLEVKMLK
jgi:hypothetical protein